jgi:hypothetical protein
VNHTSGAVEAAAYRVSDELKDDQAQPPALIRTDPEWTLNEDESYALVAQFGSADGFA